MIYDSASPGAAANDTSSCRWMHNGDVNLWVFHDSKQQILIRFIW